LLRIMGALVTPISVALTRRVEEPSTASKPDLRTAANDAHGLVSFNRSSARTSRDSGTSIPSALATCRLTSNSILVGCSTGRSAGLAPLRYDPRKTVLDGTCEGSRAHTRPMNLPWLRPERATAEARGFDFRL